MMVLQTKESKVKGADKVEKTSEEEQSNDFNGAVETVEEGSDVSPDDATTSKKNKKPVKTKSKEVSTDEETKPKDLPAKRGRKAKIENGDADSAIEEINNGADVVAKDLPRSSRRKAVEVEPADSIKEQNKPEPKDTKAKSNKKAPLQAEENSVEKEAPSKRAGRKKKPESEKGEDEKHPSIDENRHLKVSLKRNQNIDEMAKDMVENKVAEESKSNKKGGKVEKAFKKGQSNDVENDLKDMVETEKEESELPPNDKVASKKVKKPAKIKTVEESADEEIKPKDLPAKRGRKAKTENDATLAIEDNCETDADVKDLPISSRRKVKDSEPANSVKEPNKPKQAKAKSNKKTTVQAKENSVEKEPPSKGAGRKRKIESLKDKDEKHHDIDESRHLRVALKRHQSLDKMAMELLENEAKSMETDEEPKLKTAKGPAKGKGKRAAKEPVEDSKPTKKTKEDTSKSKSGAKKDKIPDVTALDFANESKTADGKAWNLKIATWNVNGVRAWLEKNGMSYLHHEKPDILCIQETKCSNDKLPPEVQNVEGYHSYWLAGDKDGYSGVGLLSKEKPTSVQYGISIEKHDNEGRVITAEYDEFYLVTTYIPNSGRGLVRLDYRQEWDKDFRAYLQKLDEKKPVVLCGDLNVAHEEIDLANPKSNKKTAGFTKEEREGFSALLSEGFIDTFRHLYPDKSRAYTFWTYMMNARAKDVGWRLDYFVISKRFVDHLCDSVIRKDVYGSDHCPIALFLNV